MQYACAVPARLERPGRTRATDISSSAERAAREDEVIDVSSRLLAGFVHDTDGVLILRRILPQALPWVTFLPPEALNELVEELVDTLQAAVSIDNLWPVSQVLVEWRHSALRPWVTPAPRQPTKTALRLLAPRRCAGGQAQRAGICHNSVTFSI